MRKIMSDVHIFLASEPLQNKCDTVKHTSFLCVSPFLPFVKYGLNKETSAETPDEPKSGKDKYKYQGHVWRCRIPRVSEKWVPNHSSCGVELAGASGSQVPGPDGENVLQFRYSSGECLQESTYQTIPVWNKKGTYISVRRKCYKQIYTADVWNKLLVMERCLWHGANSESWNYPPVPE